MTVAEADTSECDTCYVDERGNRWWNWCAVHDECRDEGCTEPAPCPTCGRENAAPCSDYSIIIAEVRRLRCE